jgi:RNAse (barnase) inhibitor barstar
MKDAIIEEVWRNRDRLADRYGHNLDAIVDAMKKRERHPLTSIARRPKARKTRAASAKAIDPLTT